MATAITTCAYCRAKNRVDTERIHQATCGICGNLVVATYYDILGVTTSASAEEMKKAYRRLALQWHPDANKAAYAAEIFKTVNQAYSVLYAPDQRRAYDADLAYRSARNSSSRQSAAQGPRDYAYQEPYAGGYHAPDMDADTASRMFLDEMYQFGLELAFQNTASQHIEPELVKRGCPSNIARMIAKQCEVYRKSLVRRATVKPFLIAVGGFIFGWPFSGFWAARSSAATGWFGRCTSLRRGASRRSRCRRTRRGHEGGERRRIRLKEDAMGLQAERLYYTDSDEGTRVRIGVVPGGGDTKTLLFSER